MAKKEEMHKEFNKFLAQAKEKFKEFGNELGILARKSEKEIVKASKAGKIQFDMMGLTMQKEKLYYDIGKKAALLSERKDLGISELEPYWKKLRSIESDTQKKKRELALVQKEK